jgi:hypothetical protein
MTDSTGKEVARSIPIRMQMRARKSATPTAGSVQSQFGKKPAKSSLNAPALDDLLSSMESEQDKRRARQDSEPSQDLETDEYRSDMASDSTDVAAINAASESDSEQLNVKDEYEVTEDEQSSDSLHAEKELNFLEVDPTTGGLTVELGFQSREEQEAALVEPLQKRRDKLGGSEDFLQERRQEVEDTKKLLQINQEGYKGISDRIKRIKDCLVAFMDDDKNYVKNIKGERPKGFNAANQILGVISRLERKHPLRGENVSQASLDDMHREIDNMRTIKEGVKGAVVESTVGLNRNLYERFFDRLKFWLGVKESNSSLVRLQQTLKKAWVEPKVQEKLQSVVSYLLEYQAAKMENPLKDAWSFGMAGKALSKIKDLIEQDENGELKKDSRGDYILKNPIQEKDLDDALAKIVEFKAKTSSFNSDMSGANLRDGLKKVLAKVEAKFPRGLPEPPADDNPSPKKKPRIN